MRRGRHIERRNPVRSPYKNNQDVCQMCGRTTFEFLLVPLFLEQKNVTILVARTHPGCMNTQDTFQGRLTKGPHYGGS